MEWFDRSMTAKSFLADGKRRKGVAERRHSTATMLSCSTGESVSLRHLSFGLYVGGNLFFQEVAYTPTLAVRLSVLNEAR